MNNEVCDIINTKISEKNSCEIIARFYSVLYKISFPAFSNAKKMLLKKDSSGVKTVLKDKDRSGRDHNERKQIEVSAEQCIVMNVNLYKCHPLLHPAQTNHA